MVEQSKDGVFFDSLNSIERFHYFDSGSRFPNRILCRLLVRQPIDPSYGKQACFYLAQRHPILNCSIEKKGRRYIWKSYPDRYQVQSQTNDQSQDPHISLANGETVEFVDTKWFFFQNLQNRPDQLPDFHDRLTAAGHFQPFMLIRQWPEGQPEQVESRHVNTTIVSKQVCSEIWLSIHHAYCDGGGGVAIINDWIQIYDNLRFHRQPNEGLTCIDQKRFAKRNHLGLGSWKFLRKLPFQPVGLFGATKFIFRKTASLGQRNQSLIEARCHSQNAMSPSANINRSAITSVWLDADNLRKLEADSAQKNINLNAILVAELMTTLEAWRLNWIPKASANHWQRIILPINIRDIADRRLPAANRSSIVQIDRRQIANQDQSKLVRSIQREVGVIIDWKLDRMFLSFMKIIGLSNRLLRHVAQNKKHRGIAVFTNLGQPFRKLEKRVNSAVQNPASTGYPNQPLDPVEIDFLAPLRHGTSLNFTVAKFKNRLRMTLHYDPIVVSAEQADELVTAFRDSLKV